MYFINNLSEQIFVDLIKSVFFAIGVCIIQNTISNLTLSRTEMLAVTIKVNYRYRITIKNKY